MSTPLRVLILEDRTADAELMAYELERAGFAPTWQRVDTERDYVAKLAEPPDLTLADYSLPQFDALTGLWLVLERGLDIPYVIVSGSISEEAAVECMKRGASDYLFVERSPGVPGWRAEHRGEQHEGRSTHPVRVVQHPLGDRDRKRDRGRLAGPGRHGTQAGRGGVGGAYRLA